MTDAPLYYIPRTGEIILSDGTKRVLVKGVRTLDKDIAGDHAADTYGVKPVHEMTADERKAEKLPPAEPDVEAPAEPAKADPAQRRLAVAAKPTTAPSALLSASVVIAAKTDREPWWAFTSA
jgi:hypothetical protein